MTKNDLMSELSKIALDISKIYGQNIQIELNCNMEYKSVKLKISEYFSHQQENTLSGEPNGVYRGSGQQNKI
jgi:hypothetical protein